jgi:RNA polymerase sigma factor (sigma-70 family)
MIETPEQLFSERYNFLLKYAYRMLRNEADAEDCVQEAFLSICQKWNQARPATIRAWATSVVHNQALDQIRKSRAGKRWGNAIPLQDVPVFMAPTVPSAEKTIVGRLVITRCLTKARLTPKEHDALMLWARGEIQDGRSTEKVRAMRARIKLRLVAQ